MRGTRRSLIAGAQQAAGRAASPRLLLIVLTGLLAAAPLPAQGGTPGGAQGGGQGGAPGAARAATPAVTPGEAQGLKSALDRGRLSPEQKLAIEGQLREAESLGIPIALLLPRLEEGIAKKAPFPRLQEALRSQASLLLEARDLLARTPGGAALLADAASWARTANLLSAGVPVAEVRLLAGLCTRRPEDYRPATSLYLSLAGWGLDRDRARELLRALLDSRLPGESFPVVMQLLVEGRRQRLAPEELARRLLLHLPQSADPEELRRRVLP